MQAGKHAGRQASRQAAKQAGKKAVKQAEKQAGKQALGRHSVGAMPWRGLLWMKILYLYFFKIVKSVLQL